MQGALLYLLRIKPTLANLLFPADLIFTRVSVSHVGRESAVSGRIQAEDFHFQPKNFV